MNSKDIKYELLKLTDKEKKERRNALKDLIFYLGECENKELAKLEQDLLGQSWFNVDNLDYVPSQIIVNKVKPLIGKQSRFMMGLAPNIQLKPLDRKNKETCEQLRQFLDAILNANKFWSTTLKAFKIATITKRVLLRLEANPEQPIKIFYHDISDFSYELDTYDISKLNKVTIVRIDNRTEKKDLKQQIWYRYIYYMKEGTCWLKKEVFRGNNLKSPIEVNETNTKLSKIPCWLVCNEQDIINKNGLSDLKDLKSLQNQINRRISDFADGLRFDMFGQTVIVDAKEDSVNNSKIAPNALMALVSLEGKKAEAKKIESDFKNAEAVMKFVKYMDDCMHDCLSIPKPEQLKNIPSAKTLKYIYSELVSRCSEKWNDWEPNIRSMIRLIVEACEKFNCYPDWNQEWNELLFNIVLKKNYPIPEDEDDKKRLAMEEVRTNVRSIMSYLKDFTDDEDVENIFKEICENLTSINAAENEQFLQE